MRAPSRSGVTSSLRSPSARRLLVRGVLPVAEVAPYDDLAVEHALEQGALDRVAVAGREHFARAAAGGGHRGRGVALHEDDRRPLEGNEAAQLPDERAECLVELERRAEGARAAVRRLEDVDAVTELVAQPFRLGGAQLGAAPLGIEGVAQAPDDDAGEHPDEHAGEGRPPLKPRAEGVDHDRCADHHGAGDGAAHEPEAQGRGRDRDQVQGTPRLARLEREDRDEPDRDNRVESEQQHSRRGLGSPARARPPRARPRRRSPRRRTRRPPTPRPRTTAGSSSGRRRSRRRPRAPPAAGRASGPGG